MSDGISAAEMGVSHAPKQSAEKRREAGSAKKLGTNLLRIVNADNKSLQPLFRFSINSLAHDRLEKAFVADKHGELSEAKMTRASLELLFEAADCLSDPAVNGRINNRVFSEYSNPQDKQRVYELTQLVKSGYEFYKQELVKYPFYEDKFLRLLSNCFA